MSLAQVYANMGDYGQVEPLLRQALAIHQSVRNRWDEMLVLNELGILYATVGQYARAYQAFEQGLQHSSDLASDIGAAYLLCNYGQAQRDGCLYNHALLTLERGLGLARAQEDTHLQAIYLSDMALTHLSTGMFVRAIEDAGQALDLFLQLEQPLSTPVVHATLAAAHLGLGNTRSAEASAHQAIAVLDECGGEGPDFPQRDYWMAANVLESLGRQEAAQSARNRALALLLARAERISDTAMRRTFLEVVPVHVAIMRWSNTR
jgi:tetratricopeptide (TPR) repeat protein